MSFSDSVNALLSTYSRCIDLLKVVHSHAVEDGDNSTDHQSLLRQSLKSDRAKVRRVYSSRLSESGSRLKKGDGMSTKKRGHWIARPHMTAVCLQRTSLTQHHGNIMTSKADTLSNRPGQISHQQDSAEAHGRDRQAAELHQEPGRGARL